MALRWFLQAISAGMVEHSNSGKQGDMRMFGVGEVEGMKLNNHKETCNLHGRVDRSSRGKEWSTGGFRVPLHYPRYKKEDYERMEEWKVEMLLKEYGLAYDGSLEEKRVYAMGAFLWPDQL